MDPYSSPYIILNNSPQNPFPDSLLSQVTGMGFWGIAVLAVAVQVLRKYWLIGT